MQLFLLGTSLASGSLIASSGILWLGVIIVRRASATYTRRTVPGRYPAQSVPA
jgi:hypothetical protein